MKKELFAAAILASLAALSAWNLCHIKSLTGEIAGIVELSASAVQENDWDRAEQLAKSARLRWQQAAGYTNVFIRHSELDLAEEAFGNYLSELYKSSPGGAVAAAEALIEQMRNIYEMERITLKSVF